MEKILTAISFFLLVASIILSFRYPFTALALFVIFLLVYILAKIVFCKSKNCPKY